MEDYINGNIQKGGQGFHDVKPERDKTTELPPLNLGASSNPKPLHVHFNETSVTVPPTNRGKLNRLTVESNMATENKNEVTLENTDVASDQEGGGKKTEKDIHHSVLKKKKSKKEVDPVLLEGKLRVITSYWYQSIEDAEPYRRTWTKQQIAEYVEHVLRGWEVEHKDYVRNETSFIISHFKQRRCKHYFTGGKKEGKFQKKARKALKNLGLLTGRKREYCACGLEKNLHTQEARDSDVTEWSVDSGTETNISHNFGNMDIPGHFNYLDSPTGTRKFLRLDDITSHPKDVWELLTTHWQLKPPNLVISITGGDVTSLKRNINLHKAFRDGLLKSAVTTSAWVLTEGLSLGASKEIGDIFQEDLRRTEWAERKDHANVPLIAVAPWGILADKKPLCGIYVGTDETYYHYTSRDPDDTSHDHVPNSLDPHHTVYLLTDDGTSGVYTSESRLRNRLEAYIRQQTTLTILGNNDVKTPLVILVLGGDHFTLQKIREATMAGISVVVVNGSGPIADMIADVDMTMETHFPRTEKEKCASWSDSEEHFFVEFIQRFKKSFSTPLTSTDEDNLRVAMKNRHLIEVFGVENGDITDLDKAILQAIFGDLNDISVQLNLTLAMDRCDIAQEAIFIESRKKELREQRDMLQNALYLALKTSRTDFVRLLLDQDYGGELEFSKFLKMNVLYDLHHQNMQESHVMGKILRSMCRRDAAGKHMVEGSDLLPQVGRVIHILMGTHYRLLYQETIFRQVEDFLVPNHLSNEPEEEAVWQLMIWAVLANQRDIAELFLFETSCKTGGALTAFKLFNMLALKADQLNENEEATELRQNAVYFENVAIQTLDELYDMSREEAYTNLVSVLPFHWGKFVTPLSLADDAKAMKFMGHPSCQTLLHLIWMKYMDLDNAKWKFFPLFHIVPFLNVPFIRFDKNNLSYGSYKGEKSEKDKSGPKSTVERQRKDSENAVWPMGSEASLSSIDSHISDPRPSDRTTLSRRLRYAWWCLKNYYTAPIMKFVTNGVFYFIFLGIFSHVLITQLKPYQTVNDISMSEWFVIVFVLALAMEEFQQFIKRKGSGPLYQLDWTDLEPDWKTTWTGWERLVLVARLYRLQHWLSDIWNQYDACMLLMFVISLILRFNLAPLHFGIARIFYVVTFLAFFFRTLRMGYILQSLGPRIITIAALIKDLFYFLLILTVFIFSFGVGFQALIDPNEPSSIGMLVNVIWRPYWQMYGEMFLDDITEGMGRELDNLTCVSDRVAAMQIPGAELCTPWAAPMLLGVFMLITNILLLNLLIAIFSHSFDRIENESKTIWRFNLYGLVHEYYHQSWLPMPLSLLCHMTNLIMWLITWPRVLCYRRAYKRHLQEITSNHMGHGLRKRPTKEALTAQEEIKKDCCFPFYKKAFPSDQGTHFRQGEYYRDEDLEEKAYKRYLRVRQMSTKSIDKKLETQSTKLQNISYDLQELKALSSSLQLNPLSQSGTPSSRQSSKLDLQEKYATVTEVGSLRQDVKEIDAKLNSLSDKMDAILNLITNED